jgi:prolyl oligopeptidase
MDSLQECARTRPFHRSASIRRLSSMLIFAALVGFNPALSNGQSNPSDKKCPPPTRTDDTVETIHGVLIADPYRWLEDQNSSETRAWIEAQDRCTAALLNAVPNRAQIAKRLSELMKVDSFDVPLARNGYYFFSKRRADQDLSVIYRRHGLQGADEVMVDPNPLSPDHSLSVELLDVSYDASLLAYGVRAGGEDEVVVHFLDTTTGKELPEQLPKGLYGDLGGVAFQRDNSGVYYPRMQPEGMRIFHHALGTPVTEDKEVFGKGYGRDRDIGLELSEDGRYLLIRVFLGTQSELYFQDLQTASPIRTVVKDIPALFYGEIQGGALYVSTNWKALNWHVFCVDLQNPAPEAWKEIIPETDAAIEKVSLIGGKILVQYVRNASSQLKVFDTDGKASGDVPLPGIGAVASSSGDWAQQSVFVNFHSFNVPPTIDIYDLKNGKMESWASPHVPFDGRGYTVEQVWYESKDKTRVPMFLFYKKDSFATARVPFGSAVMADLVTTSLLTSSRAQPRG